MVDIHHIVSDGTSHTILADEFMQLYGNGVPLEPLFVQYKDFAQCKIDYRQRRGKNQEDYWLRLYAGEIPRLNLAADYKRPGPLPSRRSMPVPVGKRIRRKFKLLGARYGGTLYMNIMAR